MAARPKPENAGAVARAESPLTRTDTPMDYSAVLAPGGLAKVSVTRDGTPNPLAGFVARAVGNALKLPVANGTEAKKVTSWLRADQRNDEKVADARLLIQYQDGKGNGDKSVVRLGRKEVDGKTVTVYPEHIREVHFVAEAGKKQSRAYTKTDIVRWFKETHNQELTGPITKEQRELFKASREPVKSDG